VIIGLEIHVQLNKLHSKLFCSCGLDYHNAPPNTHTCPVCLGLPGSLPVLNRSAVKSAIKVALAMNCEILPQTQFYRKNYYYPDLPKGFQVTQYDYPISVNGYLAIEGDEGHGVRRIRINRVHMEEDPGRLVHEGTIDRSKFTLVDYNRAGVPLLEIVTEPDLRSPKEARRFLNKLRNILEYLDVFDGDLDGAIRVDANISLAGGERAEVKNISSYKGAERALSFEIVRQRNVLRRGEVVVQETRHFDELRGVTVSMRTKETEHDYRYFPEPDLVPMRVMDWVPAIKETLPELPRPRPIAAPRTSPGTSRNCIWVPRYSSVPGITSSVVNSYAATSLSVPVRTFNKVDFPTDGKPTITMVACPDFFTPYPSPPDFDAARFCTSSRSLAIFAFSRPMWWDVALLYGVFLISSSMLLISSSIVILWVVVPDRGYAL
jgi:hypothetical protein